MDSVFQVGLSGCYLLVLDGGKCQEVLGVRKVCGKCVPGWPLWVLAPGCGGLPDTQYTAHTVTVRWNGEVQYSRVITVSLPLRRVLWSGADRGPLAAGTGRPGWRGKTAVHLHALRK